MQLVVSSQELHAPMLRAVRSRTVQRAVREAAALWSHMHWFVRRAVSAFVSRLPRRHCHRNTLWQRGRTRRPDARFVILVECRHVVEVTGMDQWMRSRNEQLDSSGDNPIQLPECPKCKTPLRRNMRYSNNNPPLHQLLAAITLRSAVFRS